MVASMSNFHFSVSSGVVWKTTEGAEDAEKKSNSMGHANGCASQTAPSGVNLPGPDQFHPKKLKSHHHTAATF
jgi:hypothetical protein